MPRIRTIKPEFPQSESVGALSRDARLLFIQLWTVVDDDGRARAASRMLASLLYPYDDDAPGLIEDWLDELETAGMIRRYRVDGSVYLDIPHWSKHQKIDHKSVSKLPAFDASAEPLAKPREPSRSLAPDLGPSTSTLDQESILVAARPAREDRFEEFWTVYPKRDGANPKEPARKAFSAAVKSGADPRDIISGAKRCAEVDKSKIGTPYIARAVTWLREKRWQDYLDTVDPAKQLSMERDMASRGYVWLDGKWQKALEAASNG